MPEDENGRHEFAGLIDNFLALSGFADGLMSRREMPMISDTLSSKLQDRSF